MDTKKEIEGLLKSLKNNGIDRDQIEKDLNYSKNYIDQTLSKGGNRRFFNALKGYAESRLQKATKYYQAEKKESIIKEPDGAYIKDGAIILIELKTASGKTIQVKPEGQGEITLLNAFLEERDRVIEELQVDKKKLQNTIDINLTAMMQLLGALSRHDRAFHETMLKSLARIEKRQENELVGEARSFEAAKQLEEQTGGKLTDAHK